MAGYSGTPLARKLGIAEGHRVVLLDAPDGFVAALAPPPIELMTRLAARANVIVLFTTARARFEARLDAMVRAMDSAGGCWIAWPKRASKVATDMTEDVVRAVALPRGLVDNKVCAIDDTWSALRLVIRVEHRAAHAAGAMPLAAANPPTTAPAATARRAAATRPAARRAAAGRPAAAGSRRPAAARRR